MPTSIVPPAAASGSRPGRGPLRLRVAVRRGRDRLDGGWWPRSRDLAAELAELVAHFPAAAGRIVRVRYSPADWDPAPGSVAVAEGPEVVSTAVHDDAHLVLLELSDDTVLRVLVIPVGFSEQQAEEALLASATPGNTEDAASLLDAVVDQPDLDLADIWDDSGGSYWDPHPVAPSYRGRR